jgi:hypothetical protein
LFKRIKDQELRREAYNEAPNTKKQKGREKTKKREPGMGNQKQ